MKHKILSILVSAVIAFGLWIYVITVVSPESEKTYYEIPVVLQNKEILLERGLMIVSETPTVTLALKSDRVTLNSLNEANINVITNVANIEKAGTHSLTYSISYPGNISHNEVSVLSSSTDLITLKVENKIKKQIPVIIDYGTSSVPDGFIADLNNAKLDYEYVDVSGPESVMRHITQAIIHVNLADHGKTPMREYTYILCNKDGLPVNAASVTTNVEKVNLTIRIQRIKEISLGVDVIDGGGATKQTSTIKLEPSKIRVSGSDAVLAKLDKLIVDTVRLEEFLEDTTYTIDLEELLPEGVTNLTGVEQVTISVKFPQLMLKSFNVTNIIATNVPKGLEVEMITPSLVVQVRGPVEMVQEMKETDLTVVVNFADSMLGTVTKKPTIVIDKKFESVGAVRTDTYEVIATLRVPQSPPDTPDTTDPT